ncbi:MAG: UDP-N-acetylmuramate--L-alanine ligase [Ruminococcus sp.]|nr:UDP-N-acetylmuramate--L-alanine ligase [Ruminococcus sp.]
MITNEQISNIKHVHFIGIGGSGMYPIAQIFHSKGYYITGSDNNETDTLQAVRNMGIEVYLGQRAENIGDADLIIYTAAIMADNPELIAAKESGALCCERAEILGLVTSWYENALCVCGTHGKTTASSMLTQIFVDEGRDISCVIGGKLPSIKGSGLAGKGDTMVCEACEFEDHFLKLYPDAAIILNVDADHLEYFKTLDNIIKSFRTFADMATSAVIYNGDDRNTVKAVTGVEGKAMITFGFGEANDYRAEIKSKKGLVTTFDVYYRGEFVRTLRIHVPGEHNVLNALAAVAAARYSGVNWEPIENGLDNFFGAIRRFQKIDEVDGITIVDDYGHHPAEIACTLKAAKGLDFNRVWVVFQPFTYTRTKLLMDDFARALEIADIAVITDIMGSREKNTVGVYTEMLGEKTKNAKWFFTEHEVVDRQSSEQKEYNFKQCAEYITENAREGDLVITTGCGDVYKLARILAQMLRDKQKGN